MKSLTHKLSHLITMESDAEISEMIANAPEEILGDLLYIATRDLSISTAKKILARQADVMKLMTAQGFVRTPTPIHYYLCHSFDYVMYEDEENFDATRYALLQLFLQHAADPNWQRQNGNGVFEAAIHSGRENLVTLLLDAGAKINSTRKASALNFAIEGIDDEQQRLGMLKKLIEAGANINGDAEYRPILIAAREGQIETIQLLLTAGADLYAQNKDGKNLLDIAIENLQQNIIDFCASQHWRPDAEQQILLDYTLAAKNLDHPELQKISKKFPESRLEQFHMICFSYAATQLKQHSSAIAWAQQAFTHTANNRALNRYIAALSFNSEFAQAIHVFESQDAVKLTELDNFAIGNLLAASAHTKNLTLAQTILDVIVDCDSTKEGAGLLYFNAACISCLQNKLAEGFRFLVAARLNQFSTQSINNDADLAALRELPEFSVLQNWENVGNDFHSCFENDKELWYFRDDLFEINFAEQTCDTLLTITGSPIERALALCFAVRDYQLQGNKPTKQMSAAVSTICEDISTAIMELIDGEDGHKYNGMRLEWDFGEGPLARYWWGQGITRDDDGSYAADYNFETYCWCGEEMYQQLVEQIKIATKPLFENRQFYIRLGEHDCGEGEQIELGN